MGSGPKELARLGTSLNQMTESLLEVNGSLEEKVEELETEITERKLAEETVRHLAYHDALTDLPNRTLLKDRLTMALAQARRNKHMLAVMFLDLDRFKVVND
ncbi:MAG: GGDEF domain-containing protein, partial [Chloroflexi bacterium]|nr:GGDEF domain-containing protein [Chloroflexota bacterium]